MAKRKNKPATAGEKIATKHLSGSRAICLSVFMEGKLAKDVDRAVSRAVKKERQRCGFVVFAAQCSGESFDRARDWILNPEKQKP